MQKIIKREPKEIRCSTPRTISEVVYDTISKEKFKELLNQYKPTEIWCREWSERKPFIFITEYIDQDWVMYHCAGEANKTPTLKSIDNIYENHKYAGLGDFHFNNPKYTKSEETVSSIS